MTLREFFTGIVDRILEDTIEFVAAPFNVYELGLDATLSDWVSTVLSCIVVVLLLGSAADKVDDFVEWVLPSKPK